jgi:hypothetical protein
LEGGRAQAKKLLESKPAVDLSHQGGLGKVWVEVEGVVALVIIVVKVTDGLISGIQRKGGGVVGGGWWGQSGTGGDFEGISPRGHIGHRWECRSATEAEWRTQQWRQLHCLVGDEPRKGCQGQWR